MAPPIKGLADPVEWLRERLVARRVEDTELIAISLSGVEAAQARPLVNAVVQAYFNEVVYLEEKERVSTVDRLFNLHRDKTGDLRKARAEFADANAAAKEKDVLALDDLKSRIDLLTTNCKTLAEEIQGQEIEMTAPKRIEIVQKP